MKKSADPRFEQELLQALRDPMRASERNAARARVSRRLEDSLLRLEVGAAAALPLLLEAPRVAATQSAAGLAAQAKALTATAGGIGGGAASVAGGAATGAGVAAATHPFSVLLTAFALGAGAGGGTLVALSAGHVFESKAAASSSAAVGAFTSMATRQRAMPAAPRASGAALAVPAPDAASAEGEPHAAEATHRERASTSPQAPAKGRVLPTKLSPADGALHSDTLTVQQALLDRARTALAHGDGRQALAALSEHARAHPASELLEEREALTIKSLITSGDSVTARARAAAFGARYPRSLFLPSIRAALPENP